MIYIYEENVEVYDNLENKSEFINEALSKLRNTTPKPDSNIEYVKQKLAEIDSRK